MLGDHKASRQDRIDALKFLIHFVGDIHQPLHAIGDALGGNDIRISEFGSSQCGTRPCNLHFAWDIGLIEHTGRREAAYVGYLEMLVSLKGLSPLAGGSPEIWANESFHFATEVWLKDGGSVDAAYFQKNIESLNERLALAGLRLANMLNQALGK